MEDLHETAYGERQYGVRDLDGHQWLFSARPTRWRTFKKWVGERKGSKLYEAADPPAEWIKAIVQMLIGIVTVITIAVLVWIPRFHGIGIAELALRIVAIGLALAAVVELTYTLFTDGPDEALNPLILGLSSFILIQISAPRTGLTMSNMGAVALLILALGALFVIRGSSSKSQRCVEIIECPKDQMKVSTVTRTAPTRERLSGPGRPDSGMQKRMPGSGLQVR